MSGASAGARLRALIARGPGLVTPGCHNALSASLAEHAGFEAMAIGGFAVEATLLGTPDIGLLTLSELVEQAGRVASAVSVPVTCDGDTGFGGVHTIARLVRALEDRGIAGVQIEDQPDAARASLLGGRRVNDVEEQLTRLRAALAARRDPDFLIIARSDADTVSIDALIGRCNRYLATGADLAMPICFVVDGRPMPELDPDAQMDVLARLARAIDGPVKASMIPDGYAASDMAAIGYAVIGLTGGPIEAAANALHGAYASLKATGSEAAYRRANPPAFPAPAGLARLLGIEERTAFERQCAGDEN